MQLHNYIRPIYSNYATAYEPHMLWTTHVKIFLQYAANQQGE